MSAPELGGCVALVEPNFTGHRLWYVALAFDRVPQRWNLVTTSEALASDEYDIHLSALDPLVTVVDDLRSNSWWKRSRALWDVLRDARTLLLDGDRWLATLLLARSVADLELLILRPVGPRSVRGWIVERVKAICCVVLSARGCRIYALSDEWGVIEELTVATLRRVASFVSEPELDSYGFRDVDRVRRDLADRFAFPDGTKLLVSVGLQSRAKGTDSVIAEWMDHRPDGWRLLLAGPIETCVLECLAERSQTSGIVVDERYLTEQDMADYVAAADVVVAAHRHRASSGVIHRAGTMRKPALTQPGTAVHEMGVRAGIAIPVSELRNLTRLVEDMGKPADSETSRRLPSLTESLFSEGCDR